jgi:hypothetical protein
MSEANKIFKPIYSASGISRLIRKPGNDTIVELIQKFEPFKGYVHEFKHMKKISKALEESHLSNANECTSEHTSESFQIRELNPNGCLESENIDPRVLVFVAVQRRGTIDKTDLDTINRAYGMNFVKSSKTQYHDFADFEISAKADGVDSQAKRIVKIRTEKMGNGMSDFERFNEKIQVLAVMKANNCRSCLFVETNSHVVPQAELYQFDDNQFEEVVGKLAKLTSYCRSLTKNEFLEMYA